MWPYYLLVIIPFFYELVAIMLCSNQGSALTKKSNNSIVIFFTIYFMILAFRSTSCGADVVVYESIFLQIIQLDFSSLFEFRNIEQLYFVFNWIVAHIYFDFRFFIVIMAFLCAGITGWFYWIESELPFLSILLFVTNAPYGMFYSGMRQSVAMLFVVPAYYFTKNKKLFPFLIMTLLATYFHKSAFVLLLLYPVFHIPLKSKCFMFVMILVAVFFLFNSQIFNGMLPILGNRYVERYGSIEVTNGYSVWIFFIMLLIFSFIVCDERKMTSDVLGLRNVLVLMTLIQGFAPIHPLSMRMNYYFIMLFPIIVPRLLNRPKEGMENVAQLIKWFLVLFLFLFYLFGVCNINRDGLHLYPYKAF